MNRIRDILKSIKPDKVTRLKVILLCVFAATTFWILNALNENYSTTLKYPLHFEYDRENYIAVEELPENIQVNVSGLGWNLFRNSLGIKVTPLKIVLESPAEVKRITGGALPALISDQLNEVQLNYVLTDTLRINIDQRVKRTFPVKIDSAGISLTDNYRIVSKISFVPDSVTLEGPRRMLYQMPDTLLVRIPENEIDRNYKEDVAILTPDNELIKRIPPTVQVIFEVEEFVEIVQSIPFALDHFPENSEAKINENNIKVAFRINRSRADEVSPDDFKAIADFRKMDKSDSTVIPELIAYPDYIVNLSMDTTKVKVYFNEED